MTPRHQIMFNRAFELLYEEYCDAGMSPESARELAADNAWAAYEQYCDKKLQEIKEGGP